MNIEEIKGLEPMRYWSLPASASETQKKKLKKEISSGNYFATEKRDGAWYRFIKDEEGKCFLQSRTVSAKNGKFVEKQDNVPDIIEQLNKLPNGTILIGEICFEDRSKISSDVVSIMGCLPKKAIERQKDNPVHYYIYDILAFDNYIVANLSAKDRMKIIQNNIAQYNFNELIEIAEPIWNNLEEKIGQWLEEGKEGAVLMHKDKPYTFGKSPAWNTIKFKQSLLNDIDLVVMGFSDPVKEYTGKYVQSWDLFENLKTGELVQGRYYNNGGYLPVSQNYFKGYVGGLILGAYYGDKLIEVGRIANLTDDIREQIFKDKNKFLGKVVQVSAMMVDQDKHSLRHPKLIRFREDKNSKECLYEDIF